MIKSHGKANEHHEHIRDDTGKLIGFFSDSEIVNRIKNSKVDDFCNQNKESGIVKPMEAEDAIKGE